MIELKCHTCPYKLGLIKCKINPCIMCRLKKLKNNPFPKAIIKHEKLKG
ncbi:MAG: hypothetical protein NC320_11985 [Clostridium sp.]|nr:hypothetical protein [Clostridium sp.]